jgi:hypothetical protein
MKSINYILVFSALLISQLSYGQENKYAFTKRANLRVGANYNFQNGKTLDSLFQFNKGAIEGNIFLGYRFDPNGSKANYFGIFGAMSSIQSKSLNLMKADQAIVLPAGYNQGKASVLEIQGGLILGNWFRISAGPGVMSIPVIGGNSVKYKYFSGTSGLIMNLGTLKLNMNLSSQFGGDLKKNIWRAGIGLGFGFDFLNTR